MPQVGTRLKQFRAERNLTMREVATAIGVPLTTYREWEYGRAIRGEFLIKLAKFFGVSAEELSGQTESKNLSTEQRLNRIKDDALFVLAEMGKYTKK